MHSIKHVLVTGGAGYVGSVLVGKLLRAGYHVRVFDSLMFGGESLLGFYDYEHFEFQKGDLRDRDDVKKAVKDIDAVVHLAAIVGDPACSKTPELAEEVNASGSRNLIDCCLDVGTLSRFLFASTCSNYGKMEGANFVCESAPLRPLSLYARLKVDFEKFILEELSAPFSVACLRFSTVYGVSPRMRFDLTVNEFTKELTLGRKLLVFGEQFWRPYCHVGDIARACLLALQAEQSKIDGQVYGVGNTDENYQKEAIVKHLLEIIPDAQVEYVRKEEDPRDYRVDFSKIKRELGFETQHYLEQGMRTLHDLLNQGAFLDPDAGKYHNCI